MTGSVTMLTQLWARLASEKYVRFPAFQSYQIVSSNGTLMPPSSVPVENMNGGTFDLI